MHFVLLSHYCIYHIQSGDPHARLLWYAIKILLLCIYFILSLLSIYEFYLHFLCQFVIIITDLSEVLEYIGYIDWEVVFERAIVDFLASSSWHTDCKRRPCTDITKSSKKRHFKGICWICNYSQEEASAWKPYLWIKDSNLSKD